jgi:hypothetical protein
MLFVEKTGGKFVALPVIEQTFTAFMFPGAWLICAIAVQFVFF